MQTRNKFMTGGLGGAARLTQLLLWLWPNFATASDLWLQPFDASSPWNTPGR